MTIDFLFWATQSVSGKGVAGKKCREGIARFQHPEYLDAVYLLGLVSQGQKANEKLESSMRKGPIRDIRRCHPFVHLVGVR